MSTISIELQDDVAERLRAEATRRETSVSELVSLGIRRVLAEQSEDVDTIARKIIKEEAELLRRLA